MTPVKQRATVLSASDRFIHDFTKFLRNIRNKGHLMKPSHRRILKKHRNKLRKLVKANTPMNMKRLILTQKGGIVPFLIPLAVAMIGAAGTVGASAAGAAIMKS